MQANFNDGFLKYLNDGIFADLIVKVKDQEFKLHQLLVSCSSETFKYLINDLHQKQHKKTKLKDSKNKDPYSSNDDEQNLDNSISKVIKMSELTADGIVNVTLDENILKYEQFFHLFPDVIKFMYTGSFDITFDNLIPIIHISEVLFIHPLLKQIDEFIENNVTIDYVNKLILPSIESKVERLISHLLSLIATNFSYFIEEQCLDFSSFPYDIMNSILHHPNLFVADESHIFHAVESFLSKYKSNDLTEEMLESLFENIRFEYVDYKILESALSNPLVPKTLLSQALMNRLAGFENPNSVNIHQEEITRRRRTSYGRLFHPSSQSFENKDALYYIATNEYREKWKNPHLEGLIEVKWSSLEKGSAEYILERKPKECWSQDVPSSWLQIDLGPTRSLRITQYSLRHGTNSKKDLIRNWVLKASIDGKEYDTLRRHKDDESLTTPFGSKTWSIQGCKKRYRYFKIIQTGHNSSKNNFLSISGIELFGELIYERTK